MRKVQGEFSLTKAVPRSLAIWFACNLIFSATASYILFRAGHSEAVFGPSISAVSFISAFTASWMSLRGCKKGLLVNAAGIAGALTVASLLVGFIIDSEAIDASCILSLVTFAFSGCFIGAVITPDAEKRKRRIKTGT